jgi:polyisoprenoid-binding protein YceI
MIISNRIKRSIVSGFLVFTPLLTEAAAPQWQIVPNESQLTFTATQNGAPITGQFKTFTGDISFDPNDLKNSSIDIIVDINSISASYSELKDTLINTEWFNVKMFPKAQFKSSQIEKAGDKSYQAKGILTIRDKSEPVILTFTSEQPDANKEIVVGNTTIKRTQFGIGQGQWSSTKEIKDDVTINFKVVGVKNK